MAKKKFQTNSNQQMKRKLRASKEWKELRQKIKEQQKVDPVTGSLLTKSFNLHHLSQSKNIEDYTNLDETRFVGLNSQTHDLIHALYRVYERDGNFDFLEKIKNILIEMKTITEKDIGDNK